jgi:hypothetical protein
VVGDGLRFVDLVAADGEGERDEETARGDERNHVTDGLLLPRYLTFRSEASLTLSRGVLSEA